MKKKTMTLWALLLAAAILTGCSAKSMSQDTVAEAAATPGSAYNRADEEKFYGEASGGQLTADTSTDAPAVADSARKLIKTVWLEAETENFNQLLTGVNQQIDALEGYVESRNVYTGSTYRGQTRRTADMTIRIPADRLEEFVTQVSGIANVVSSNETADDVTLSYADIKSRQTALEVERDRLLELMEQAETMEDLLEIEARLTDVRYQLESAASQLKLYDNLVSYSTVHLSITEVQELTPQVELSGWERITTGLTANMSDMLERVTDFLIALVVSLPYWIPVAILAVPVFLLIRRSNRKAKAKREAEIRKPEDHEGKES